MLFQKIIVYKIPPGGGGGSIASSRPIGHTRVTHSYLLQGEEHPQCVGCDAPFTVRHFLLECGDFAQVRNNCFHVNNMKELFQDIQIDSIMTFLRQINLFNKI